MCIICDEGATPDECRFNIYGIIDRYGWFIQGVKVEPVARSWAYTIGLSAGFDHPELVITGVTMETAGRILNEIGETIRAGAHFTHGQCFVDDQERHAARLSEVHPAHFDRGVFAVWQDYYECLGSFPPARVLEVVLPGRKPMLARPWSPIG
jgi:hypothetical protein